MLTAVLMYTFNAVDSCFFFLKKKITSDAADDVKSFFHTLAELGGGAPQKKWLFCFECDRQKISVRDNLSAIFIHCRIEFGDAREKVVQDYNLEWRRYVREGTTFLIFIRTSINKIWNFLSDKTGHCRMLWRGNWYLHERCARIQNFCSIKKLWR